MDTFDPALYSHAELRFIRHRAGEPPAVIFSERLPDGVNPVAARDVLGAIYELEEIRKHRGESWAGIDRVKESIDVWLREYERNQTLHRMGAPRWPSMSSWDGKGRAHRYGPGSDSGHVRTWIDSAGTRHAFAILLKSDPKEEFVAPWSRPPEPLPEDLIERVATDGELGAIECPLCGFAQNFSVGSAASKRMARTRVARHLKSMTGVPGERHRELYTALFGTTDGGHPVTATTA